jgi:hypothetical protein
MPKVEHWKCGDCGKLKGEDNHWFAITVYPDGFFVGPLSTTPSPSEVYCGEECLHRAMSHLVTKIAAAREVLVT